MGKNQGQRIRKIGKSMGWKGEPSFFKSPLCLYQNGFTLHAERSLKAGQRSQLEDLLRYMARPPLCDQRMRELENGDVEITLKRPFSDGTRAIKFTPLELLEKIAAFIPPIGITLLYMGEFLPVIQNGARV